MTNEKEILAEGDYLRLVRQGTWEYAERTTTDAAVIILAQTAGGRVVLVEQHRPAMGTSVIEFPAGLVGDEPEFEGEEIEVAAKRELLEETGYEAEELELLTQGPPSSGMSAEIVYFLRASGLRKVAEGGGDETEDIKLHEVHVADIRSFLQDARDRGAEIDPKIYAGLYFLEGALTPPDETSVGANPAAVRRPELPIELSLSDRLFARLDTVLPPLPASGRVGILGGTFNPPHVGHALLAHAIVATEEIEELWVIPVAEHPFGKESVDFGDRLEMCRLNFEQLGDRVRVLDLEKHLPKPSFTVQTLSVLHAVRPGIAPTLVIGSDVIPELPRWREPEKLGVLSQVLVVPRQGAPEIEPPEDLELKVYQGFRLPKVSSTTMREALKGGSVDGLLHRRVLEYIRSHDLYANHG